MVRLMVRGMGVAVMVMVWGGVRPVERNDRCLTPNLCCSSMMSKPIFFSIVFFW